MGKRAKQRKFLQTLRLYQQSQPEICIAKVATAAERLVAQIDKGKFPFSVVTRYQSQQTIDSALVVLEELGALDGLAVIFDPQGPPDMPGYVGWHIYKPSRKQASA